MNQIEPKFKFAKTRSIHDFTSLTPRSWSKVSFSIIEKVTDFTPIEKSLHRLYKRVGRPPYSKLTLFKAILLQRLEGWQFDTLLVKKLHEIEEYRQFCGFKKSKIPSHDTISRFKRKLPIEVLDKVFFELDEELAALGTFEEDDLAIDATEIVTYSNSFKRTDSDAGIGHKSDKRHFHGYWELLTVGTKSEMVRLPPLTSPGNKHQILQMKKLLSELQQYSHLNYTHVLADGIFDTQEIYQIILDDLKKLPVIKYNPKGSKHKRLEELPNGNWRFFNPLLLDIPSYHKKYNERTAVERFNGRLKDGACVRRSNVRGLQNNHKFVYFGIITMHLITLTLQYLIKNTQKKYQLSLKNFLGGNN
ncbi:MAG TPA: transposase [Candidatus Deferrimicrobium sp.]|nr:transposase [Candidatus Deferrimicrobium sp.]